jgi:hypothetical protein
MARQAMADGWSWMPGTAGVIQNPENTNWNRINGQGVDFDLKQGKATWVHIPIPGPPVPNIPKVDRIKLYIFQGSPDITLTAVHIYSSAWKKKEIIPEPYSGNGVHYHYREISLGETYDFAEGASISMQLTAGADSSKSHRFCMAGAAVYWITTPTATAVELSSFSASTSRKGVSLEWQTAQEVDNAGFHLLRSPRKNGKYRRITNTIIPLMSSPWGGTGYSHEDREATPGKTWFYKLEDIDYTGKRTLHGPVSTAGDSYNAKQGELQGPSASAFQGASGSVAEHAEATDLRPLPPPRP